MEKAKKIGMGLVLSAVSIVVIFFVVKRFAPEGALKDAFRV